MTIEGTNGVRVTVVAKPLAVTVKVFTFWASVRVERVAKARAKQVYVNIAQESQPVANCNV